MNNVFKVIWNHATQTWTAVGELASAKGKSKSIKLAVISTALLVVAGGAQAAAVVHKAEGNGSLSISTADKPTDPVRAYAYANNGIAIGNGAKSGKEDARGYSHIAIGFNADASNISSSSSTAIGANSKATGQGSTAIGNASHSTGMNSTALGNSSVAGSDGATALGVNAQAKRHAIAIGNTASSLADYTVSIGTNSKANSNSSIAIGNEATVSGQWSMAIGKKTSVNGDHTVAIGDSSKIESKNVSTLGANITVDKGRDGGVVLGHSSDAAIATTKVEAVNNAKVGNLTYSGFAGKLDAPTTALQGHFVSVGKKGDERQIKHVAAGKIDSTSTDAINGSQLYSVADTLGKAMKVFADSPIDYTTAKAGDKDVVRADDGKWYKKDDVENGKPKNGATAIPDTTPIAKQGATLKDSKGETYTPNTPDATKPESKDTITAGEGGVQLNNVGWATKPDQAVNKDQLDQTVNKSGFYVQQNGRSTLEKNSAEKDATKSEKVTPNDVINFADGHGTRVRAVTEHDKATGVDKTTVYVDINEQTKPNSLPAVYTDENGNKLQPGGNGYYPADAVKIGDKWYPKGTDQNNVATAKPLDPISNVVISMNHTNSLSGNAGKPITVRNVAPGKISKDSTDAVNGSQLYELDRKVNKQGKEARAGIAGANAAAALPQVYNPGKSMVAASAGTFKGQNALAVGYSRASDNGKVILKLQGNANTSGDVGAGVGVGYQW